MCVFFMETVNTAVNSTNAIHRLVTPSEAAMGLASHVQAAPLLLEPPPPPGGAAEPLCGGQWLCTPPSSGMQRPKQHHHRLQVPLV